MNDKTWHETLRVGLIKWNVAPLCIVALFCYFGWLVLDQILKPNCEASEWYIGILAGLATGIFGFLFQMYGSIQKNRGE